jgi:hypothetical protein
MGLIVAEDGTHLLVEGAVPTDFLTYDPVLSRIRISIAAVRTAIGADDTAAVQRSADQVAWTTVRGAASVPVTSSALPVDDYEFTPDTVNYYRAVPASHDEQDDSITPDLAGQWWLKHIRFPFLNMIITPSNVGDVTRPSMSGVFNVVGRSLPVVVSLPRASAQWSLTVATQDLEDLAALNALLATGDVLLLQVPSGAIIKGGYFAAGDTTETRNTVPSQKRWVTIPLTEAASPDPAVTGTTVIWQTVIDDLATWSDVRSALPAWADVLSLIGAPADVVVT